MTVPVQNRRRWGKAAGPAVAAVATAAIVAAPLSGATAADIDYSEASAHVIGSSLLGDLELLGVGYTHSSLTAAPGVDQGTVDLDLLGGNLAEIELPSIPLVSTNGEGLIDLADVGALQSRSHASSPTVASAEAGVVGDDGAVNLDPEAAADGNMATIDLTLLFDQLEIEELTNLVLSEASIELGAVASQASKTDGTLDSEYLVAGAELVLNSPAVASISTEAGELLSDTTGTLETILTGVNDDILGGLSAILTLLGLSDEGLSVEVTGLEGIGNDLQQILIETPLVSSNGAVEVNLGTGEIRVNLDTLVGGLNGQEANTEVIDDDLIAAILAGITDALGGATTTVSEALEAVIYGTEDTEGLGVDIHLDVKVPTVGTQVVYLDVDLTLGELLGAEGMTWAQMQEAGLVEFRIAGSGLPVVGHLLNGLTGVLVDVVVQDLVGGVVDLLIGDEGLFENLTGEVSAITTPLLTSLSPVLDGVVGELVQLTLNEQPTPANLEGDAFTVNALSVTLLPLIDGGLADVDLASSSIRALDEAPVSNASASAAASAAADGDNNAAAQAAAQAAGNADATSTASAAADANAEAAAAAAANATASEDASSDATSAANASANAAATATSDSASNSDSEANASTAANGNASAAAAAAANANSSAEASAAAAGDADADPDADATATSTATADTDADSDAAADPEADATATATATSTADSDADSDAAADPEADATATATSTSTADTDADADAAADPEADATATATATAETDADADASADPEADATATSTATADTDADADAAADPEADATATADTDADADADGNVNAAASASASANADSNANAAAQAAAQAAANADATAAATAAADATAAAAAQAAATADASTTASADVSSDANAAAQAAAQAAAESDSSADASAAADANAAAAAAAAADAQASADASAAAAADANGDDDGASASASAAATSSTNANGDDDGASASSSSNASANADSNAGANGNGDGDLAQTGAELTWIVVAAGAMLLVGLGFLAAKRAGLVRREG